MSGFADIFGGLDAPAGLSEDEVKAMIDAATDPSKMADRLKEHSDASSARFDMHEALSNYLGESRTPSPIVRHTDPKNKISLDKDMTLGKAQVILAREREAEEQMEDFIYPLQMRWEDGAVALIAVLEELYGASGRGQQHFSFFGGAQPPAKIEVTVGVEKDRHGQVRNITKTVPITGFQFEPLEATFDWQQHSEGDQTGLFALKVNIKKKNENSAKAIAKMIEEYCNVHSIYRGQVLKYEPEGNDYRLIHVLRETDSTIVYSEEAATALEDEVLGKITASKELRAAGEPDIFKVLVYGPLGTGKTEFLRKTAVVAQQYGRTVIEYNPKQGVNVNELIKVHNIARQYGDVIILIEDFDQFCPVNVYNLSLLTNLFDGLDKTARVSYLMTTNHLDKVEPEMTRPPRLTGIIEVAKLDRAGVEEMFRRTLGSRLAPDVDFDQIWEIVKEFSPSFIKTSFKKARAIAIQRGRGDEKLTTAALVGAARSLVAQHNVHKEQVQLKEGKKPDYLTLGLTEVFEKVAARMEENDN